MNSPLLPHSADALLFDLGRVVLDIDFGKVVASWAGHAGSSRRIWSSGFRPMIPGIVTSAARSATPNSSPACATHWALGSPTPSSSRAGTRSSPAKCPILRPHWRAPDNVCRSMPSPTPITRCRAFQPRLCRVLGHFREVYLSSTIGLRKPEAAAYDHVVKRSACRRRASCSSTIPPPTSTARGRGALTAVHVTSPDDVAKALEALGI